MAELAAILKRRTLMIEEAEAVQQKLAQLEQRGEDDDRSGSTLGEVEGQRVSPDDVTDDVTVRQLDTTTLGQSSKTWNPYSEYKEFSRKQLQHYQKMFNSYDLNKDKYIDFDELKHMMEKLGSPQTHLALKAMIREVDEDRDNRISYREFLLIFRKAKAGEFSEDSGLYEIYRNLTEIDVDKEGVKGAKNFFEAKIVELTQLGKFEQEIRDEQEERRRAEDERKHRKQAFRATAQFFQSQFN